MDALDKLRQISLEFKQATTLLDFLQLAGVIALLILAYQLLVRYYPALLRRQERGELFDQLCSSHGLGGADRRLLEELIQQEKLDNKLKVFVCKSILDRRIQSSSGMRRKRLESISDKLFGDGSVS